MAKISNQDYSIRHGKMSKDSPVVYRVRNGRQQSYTPKDNLNPPSPAQKAHRKLFGKVTALVNAIMADPQQAAEWEQRRIAYNKSIGYDVTLRRYTTTRSYAHFVITSQLEQQESTKRRRKHITKQLPKGFKLQIKHFSELSTTELYEILKARFIVFYSEQKCHYLDMDDIDYESTHIALHHKGHVIAYARLFRGKEPGQWIIGRLLTIERKQGFGKYIMQQAELEAQRQGATSLFLHAQTQVVPFYEALGFHTSGNIFIEADIPHVCITKSLTLAHD